jgi:two-component system, NarL family, response regulator NreC
MKQTRILIADDHEVVRQGLRMMLNNVETWEVCGEAISGYDAVTMCGQLKPDVAVLDHSMPGLNGIEATRQIKQCSPETEVIVFSGTVSDAIVHQVFEAGARSFISKSEAAKHLVAAIQSVSQHKPYFTEDVSQIVFARYLNREAGRDEALAPQSRLTGREREIVQLIAEGKTNKEIGDLLGISTRTAETHRSTLMRKLQLRTLADVVRYAIRNKIIEA